MDDSKPPLGLTYHLVSWAKHIIKASGGFKTYFIRYMYIYTKNHAYTYMTKYTTNINTTFEISRQITSPLVFNA